MKDKKRQALQVGIADIKNAHIIEKTARQIFDEVVAHRNIGKGRFVFWIFTLLHNQTIPAF